MIDTTKQTEATIPDRVSCLVLSIAGAQLLLPITAVAEVVTTAQIPEGGESGGVFYGWINWRDQRIPLLSGEVFLGGDKPALEFQNRMVIINAVYDAEGLGFYGLLLQGLPRPVQVSSDILRSAGEATEAGVTRAYIGEEGVIVPDIQVLEALAASLHSRG